MKRSIHLACRGFTLLAFIAVMAMGLNVAHAKNIKKQNLLELMTHTEAILVGTVSDKTDGFHMGLPYTEITLEVGSSIKGDHGSKYTFRQFGLIEPREMDNGKVNLMVTPAGWPVYAKGEQVMLFLHKPASETGFQTTAGLNQGKFTIRGDRVANDMNNDSLFAGVKINSRLSAAHQSLTEQAGGSYAMQDFITLIETAVKEQWIENGVMTDEK